MTPTITEEWTFTTAQTNAIIKAVPAGSRVVIYGAVGTCSNSNTGDVSLRCGTAASALPTVSNDSLTGNVGVPISHPGIAKGGGFVWSGGGQGEPICTGVDGEDVLLTCSAATGGSVVLVLKYWIESLAENP